MQLIDKIKMDYEPRKEIVSKLKEVSNMSEMEEAEAAFLCGILNWHKPIKILEIGVAAGGTTAIILQCMKNMNSKSSIFLVDNSAEYYRENGKEKTGFLAYEASRILGMAEPHKYIGKILPDYLDEIGSEIDFVLLDTMHVLPGEVLDFLVLLPHLKRDAVVCLHDIALNQWRPENFHSNATNVLLHSVCGRKILNFVEEGAAGTSYPNIGAFQITKETRENIIDVFLALTLRWRYMPSQSELKKYSELIHHEYDAELCKIYDAAVKMNRNNMFSDLYQSVPEGCRVILYGAGRMGRMCWEQLQGHCVIVQWLDMNAEAYSQECEHRITNPHDTVFENYDFVLIAVQSPKAEKEIRKFLHSKSVQDESILWWRGQFL